MKRALFISLLILVSFSLPAKKITGNVHCGDQMIPGVIVTDGFRFTTTDKQGFFKLKIKGESRYVQIVTPSGYTADYTTGSPLFYEKISKKTFYPFAVYKTNKQGSDYSLLAVSDPQMSHVKHLAKFKAEPLKDLITVSASRAAERNTVGVALGDIAWNRLEIQPLYKEEIRRTGIPFYSVIGNHDFIQNISGVEACKTYEENFGPVNWAAWIGKDLLIGVCSSPATSCPRSSATARTRRSSAKERSSPVTAWKSWRRAVPAA